MLSSTRNALRQQVSIVFSPSRLGCTPPPRLVTTTTSITTNVDQSTFFKTTPSSLVVPRITDFFWSPVHMQPQHPETVSQTARTVLPHV